MFSSVKQQQMHATNIPIKRVPYKIYKDRNYFDFTHCQHKTYFPSVKLQLQKYCSLSYFPNLSNLKIQRDDKKNKNILFSR